jgi:hypothetical protein
MTTLNTNTIEAITATLDASIEASQNAREPVLLLINHIVVTVHTTPARNASIRFFALKDYWECYSAKDAAQVLFSL